MNAGSILTLIVGLTVTCVGLVQLGRRWSLRRSGVASVGTVVRHDEILDDGPMYSPVIAFADEDGVRREFTVAGRTSWRVHRVGQQVPVTYPVGRPDAPRLSSAGHDALVIGVPLAFGVLFTVFGVLGLRSG